MNLTSEIENKLVEGEKIRGLSEFDHGEGNKEWLKCNIISGDLRNERLVVEFEDIFEGKCF